MNEVTDLEYDEENEDDYPHDVVEEANEVDNDSECSIQEIECNMVEVDTN